MARASSRTAESRLAPPFPDSLPDLIAELRQLLEQIPRGMVTTYGDLARSLGDPQARSARWIGEYLKHHAHSTGCPCYRVVRVTGEPGCTAGLDVSGKVDLLQQERVPFLSSAQVDLERCRFTDFQGGQPLAQLLELQNQWARAASYAESTLKPRMLAGLDIAYDKMGTAFGVAALLNANSLEVVDYFWIRLSVSFPYIPGFLAFRELPVYLELWRLLKFKRVSVDVVLLDGHGLLHPRRAGAATSFAVLTGAPSIGVGKSLLCGQFSRSRLSPESSQPVGYCGTVIGYAVQSAKGAKPVFVSPGSGLSLSQALSLVQSTFKNHRVPEPIYWADRQGKLLSTGKVTLPAHDREQAR